MILVIEAITIMKFLYRKHSSLKEFRTARVNQFSKNIILVKHTFFLTNFVLGMDDLNVLRNSSYLLFLILLTLPSDSFISNYFYSVILSCIKRKEPKRINHNTSDNGGKREGSDSLKTATELNICHMMKDFGRCHFMTSFLPAKPNPQIISPKSLMDF